MKAVAYSGTARRSLRKLPAKVRERIEARIADYAATGTGDVVMLQARDGARLRVGDYRVIFVETATDIQVMAVGHRRDVYR
jgi:mRNA interferase RelE/StbE